MKSFVLINSSLRNSLSNVCRFKPHSHSSPTDLFEHRSSASAMASGLGNLGGLPLEMRYDIYSFSLPDDFRQTYTVDPSSGTIQKTSQSLPLPSFFAISKAVLAEVLESVMNGRACQIWITEDSITTNFPLYSYSKFAGEGSGQLIRSQIPKCQKVRLTVFPPSPRLAEGFLRVRRNVVKVFGCLESYFRASLPRVEVELGFVADYSGVRIVSNDFCTLVGPLVS